MTFFNINDCKTMSDLMVGILLTAVIKKQRNVDNATLYQGKVKPEKTAQFWR